MATGGTIPSNRTQTVSFFNTTGIIERHKNVYYVPRFSKTGATANQAVKQAYLNAFKVVCPPSSSYTDIEVSSWSPEDRTLRVKGNIDDFRCVTDEGESLNYFIITRSVTKGSTTKVYYYAFFISKAEQSGGSTVSLTIIPDDFTNVFYLHNDHSLTLAEISADYEPFNESLKNCYVNRQHYDRLRVTYRAVVQIDATPNNYSVINVNDEIMIGDNVAGYRKMKVIANNAGMIKLQEDSDNPILFPYSQGTHTFYNWYFVNDPETVYSWVSGLRSITESNGKVIHLSDSKIFLNQEETFKFKYQYRDDKYPIAVGYSNPVFTSSERQVIANATDFNNIYTNLKRKMIMACLNYLVVETKSLEIASNIDIGDNRTQSLVTKNIVGGNLVSNTYNKPNLLVAYPCLIIPEQFSHLSNFNVNFVGHLAGYPNLDINGKLLYSGKDVYSALGQKGVGDYIYASYMVKSINLPYSVLQFGEHSTYMDLIFNLSVPNGFPVPPTTVESIDTSYEEGCYIGGIIKDPDYITTVPKPATHIYWDFNGDMKISTGVILQGIVISGKRKTDLDIILQHQYSDVKENYYDPTLDIEPYRFYSLSTYGNYEMTFIKNRYFKGDISSHVNISLFTSINGAIKVGLIPEYNLDDIPVKYFNEGLTFTVSSSMPIVSDSYYSYYYQNKAQMMNQYAVNDYNRRTDLYQQGFVSSPTQVGRATLRGAERGGQLGAGVGFITETANQVAGWVNDAIDWKQSNKVIEMNQKAKLADMGMKPDAVKQAGSDVDFDTMTKECNMFINHYTIDEMSYNSIAKMLERVGYQINLYDTLHVVDRVGWNFVKLNNFDYNPSYKITVEQESTIRSIFTEGVTLLHDKTYLTSGHNYETILEE